MSQQHYQHGFSFNQVPAGSASNINYFNFNLNPEQEGVDVVKSSDPRRDGTKVNVERLYQLTLINRQGEPPATRKSGRKNKNEILGLTLARLIKEKHLCGVKYSENIELSRGISIRSNNSDFVMVLRLDGRIVAMSDEVENHLGKSMRSLYTQCINIFQCLDETDGERLRSILNASNNLIEQEHKLVCTFRLPKGKRPSRIREDVKTITMVGHFYSCHDPSSPSYEKLFIARCEALISRTTNGSSSSSSSLMTSNANNDHTNSMVKLTLNEDMSISFASSNVKDILGYSRNEMMGNWFGRYLSSNDLEKFETIRQRHFQHEANQQQAPTNVCDIFDIYANNGDNRLTFLCQIRPIRERRSKIIKFHVVAQLIDPTLRDQYMKYVEAESESEIKPKLVKAEQVNYVSSSISKTSEDTIMANSPSLDMGLLMPDNTDNSNITRYQQPSPFHRSLSKVVAPIDIDDESWRQLLDFDYHQYSATTDFSYWSTKLFECELGQDLNDIFSDCLDEYLNGGDCF